MNFYRAFLTTSGLTGVSRVLGYVRDVLIAAALGAGLTADAFFVAFKLPNLFRRLFAEGAFSAAFVPIFARHLENRHRQEARDLAERTLAVLTGVLAVLVVLGELVMPVLVAVMTPGFRADPAKFALTVELTRITFPYLLLISLVALFGGMLNSAGRFAAFAAAPILLNLSVIAAALLVRAQAGAGTGHVLAWGIVVGGVAQLCLLGFALARAGLLPRPALPRLTPGVKQVLTLFAPAALGAGVVQVNLLVDQFIASFLPTGAISFLYYADRINQLPLGVVGIAVGTALLPLLSRQIEAGEATGANDSQNRAVELVLVLCIPAAAALTVIARPVIAVLFERGAFDAATTRASADALVAFALGLPAYVLIKVFASAFFARGNTATPVRVALVGLGANIAFNLAFVWHFAHVGIALATACAGWVNAALLYAALRHRGHIRLDRRLKRRLPGIVLASALMAAALWLLNGRFAADDAVAGVEQALTLALLIAVGLLVYGLAARLLGVFRVAEIKALARRR